MDVFPPCAEDIEEFTLQYIINGPICLLMSGISFVLKWQSGGGEGNTYFWDFCILFVIYKS